MGCFSEWMSVVKVGKFHTEIYVNRVLSQSLAALSRQKSYPDSEDHNNFSRPPLFSVYMYVSLAVYWKNKKQFYTSLPHIAGLVLHGKLSLLQIFHSNSTALWIGRNFQCSRDEIHTLHLQLCDKIHSRKCQPCVDSDLQGLQAGKGALQKEGGKEVTFLFPVLTCITGYAMIIVITLCVK